MSEEPAAPRFQRHVQAGSVISRRTVLFGAAGALFLVACGDDSALLAEASSDASSTASADSTVDASEGSADTSDTTTAAESPASAATAAGELIVSFTYTMSSEGKQENPYIAVWVEDANGDLVDTIAVWFLQGQKGTEWLSDLSAWYSDVAAAGADYSSVSGATRVAGTYAVSWQGSDGAGVLAGDYFVNVESVREDGPTSLTRQAITVVGPASVGMADDGELSAASIELVT